MNLQNEPLFELIKSLTKSEKRQFRLYCTRLEASSEANFMKLFDLLEKAKTYDEHSILSNTKIKKQQLSNTKAHLYRQILISLKLNPIHQSTRVKIRELLDYATILYNKGLYKQSLRMLDKAKSQSIKEEQNALTYQILELEKQLESQYITHSVYDRAEQLTNDSEKILEQNTLETQLSNLSLALYSWFLKNGYARCEADTKRVDDYCKNQLPICDFGVLSFMGKVHFLKSKLWVAFISQNFVACYRYSHQILSLFEAHPTARVNHHVFYLKTINANLESLFYLQEPARHQDALLKLEQLIESKALINNENVKTLSTLYHTIHRINQFFLTADFQNGVAYVPVILDQLATLGDKIDHYHQMLFYYKIACLYFGNDDYKKCILYLSKIINHKKVGLRDDLLCYTRILNLVAHYEAGDDYQIESLIRKTYKFLISMNHLYEVQKKMIDFLKQLPNLYPRDLKSAFKKLHQSLSTFKEHPYEKRAFFYLDILSWLESHIEGERIINIIQKKVKDF